MAIIFPLDWPSDLTPASMQLRPVTTVAESKSPFTGAQQIYEHPGEWWEMDITLPPLTEAKGRDLTGFLVSLRGKRGTVLLGDPAGKTARGAGGGTPLADSSASPTPNRARERELVIDGAPVSTTGWLRRGDYIQLGSGSGSRLHMLTADADTDGSGSATLNVWPALRADVADNASVTLGAPKGVFRLGQRPAIDIDVARFYGVTLTFVEAV